MNTASAEPFVAPRRERVAWYFCDWANSAFFTTVVSALMGPYLTEVAKVAADAKGLLHLGPMAIDHRALWPYASGLSVFLQVLLLPILGALADYSQRKKLMLGITTYLGSVATMALFFIRPGDYLPGAALFILANLCFGASTVFTNSFLPELAPAEKRDSVSSQGWAFGYIGGGLLLFLNLLLFMNGEKLGVSTELATRISLASAGIWAAAFTLIPMIILRDRQTGTALPAGENYLTIGFRQIRHTLIDLKRYPQTLLFLLAALIYNDGIHTVMTMAGVFGAEVVGLDRPDLMKMLLLVQVVAFGGALLFNVVSKTVGTRRAIVVSLVIWCGTVIYAYALLKTKSQFFILAAVIALVLGGSQALTRSLFSLMIPRGKEAEYFSIYEISQHGTSWLGPIVFGLALQYMNSYRVAILSLIVFFTVGLILLLKVDVKKAIASAGNQVPERI